MNNYNHYEGVKLYFLNDNELAVLFTNGITKKIKISLLISKFQNLKPLLDPIFFKTGRLFNGGIVWNDYVDLDVNQVYDLGETIKSELNTQNILVGYRIKQIRLSKGLNQQELASKCDMDQADISKLESGKLNISINLLQRVVNALDSKIEIVID